MVDCEFVSSKVIRDSRYTKHNFTCFATKSPVTKKKKEKFKEMILHLAFLFNFFFFLVEEIKKVSFSLPPEQMKSKRWLTLSAELWMVTRRRFELTTLMKILA